MPLNRRELLRGGALTGAGVLGAGILGSGTAHAQAAEAPTTFNPASWSSVRAQFSLDPNYAYFGAWIMAPHSAKVRAAVTEYRDILNSTPQLYPLPEEDFTRGETIRDALGQFIGATRENIVLTDSTTMGIGLVYGGLKLSASDDVLTTVHDFYPTHETLRLRSLLTGFTVRKAVLYDDPVNASVDQIVSRLQAAILDTTRLIAITWVHSGTGVKLPIKEITAMVADINARRDPEDHALVCVDGVHGFGAEDVTISDLGADFFMSGTHKWLFGPRGTGFIVGKPDKWPLVHPIFTSFSAVGLNGWITDNPPSGPPGDLVSPGGFHSFENRWALPAAIDFYESIGRSRIVAWTKSQAAWLKNAVDEIPNVHLVTPHDPEVSAGIICVSVDGMDSATAVQRLLDDHRIVASATPYAESYLRFGPSIVTTPQQGEKLIAALKTLH